MTFRSPRVVAEFSYYDQRMRLVQWDSESAVTPHGYTLEALGKDVMGADQWNRYPGGDHMSPELCCHLLAALASELSQGGEK